jgi:hypothetical protein
MTQGDVTLYPSTASGFTGEDSVVLIVNSDIQGSTRIDRYLWNLDSDTTTEAVTSGPRLVLPTPGPGAYDYTVKAVTTTDEVTGEVTITLDVVIGTSPPPRDLRNTSHSSSHHSPTSLGRTMNLPRRIWVC